MVAGIAQRRFTVAEFHRMVEAGILREDDRLELVQGVIVEMPPIGPRHSASTDRLAKLLILEFQALPVIVRVANPIHLDDDTELYPDFSVVQDRGDYYYENIPTASDIRLVIEISDSTLSYDRRTKGHLYASAGIPEYWILDVKAGLVSVHRAPASAGYSDISLHRAGEVLVPLFAPHCSIAVQRFLSSTPG